MPRVCQSLSSFKSFLQGTFHRGHQKPSCMLQEEALEPPRCHCHLRRLKRSFEGVRVCFTPWGGLQTFDEARALSTSSFLLRDPPPCPGSPTGPGAARAWAAPPQKRADFGPAKPARQLQTQPFPFALPHPEATAVRSVKQRDASDRGRGLEGSADGAGGEISAREAGQPAPVAKRQRQIHRPTLQMDTSNPEHQVKSECQICGQRWGGGLSAGVF